VAPANQPTENRYQPSVWRKNRPAENLLQQKRVVPAKPGPPEETRYKAEVSCGKTAAEITVQG